MYGMGVIFCQIFFLSHEEVSKSAEEWVFYGMNQRCLEMAIQKSSKKNFTFLKHAKTKKEETMPK